ncbi:protein draper-like isoform X2 [Pecten maximus]|uniref:protein draper-like isoform X2 n=1 Tax=Pecten maximus TaxID=6579 RepID=UPI0014581915|nr:protein draper-like isoform X2 [Pecten maximus]
MANYTEKMTRRFRTIIITERVNTTDAQCHAYNSIGCIRWEYYKDVSRTVNESYIENHHVQACCLGFQQIDDTCEVCREGTFGWRCEGFCRCPVNSKCDANDGQCSCLPGLTGENCDEECPDGFYGPNCSSSCNCPHPGDCHKVTGKCFSTPNQVNEHTPDSVPPTQASSIIYYVVIAVPAGLGLIIIILNALLIYRCRLRKRLSERGCSQRGTREDYETIDDHFLSNNYVDMPHTHDTGGFKVIDSGIPDETYNEIHPEIHHGRNNEEQYTEVTCIIENTKRQHTSITSCQGDTTILGNYDTMSRSWERNINDENSNESDYNTLEKDLISYDTFKSVKEASSIASLPAYLDDNYSNVNITEKGESLKSLNVGSLPP